MSTTATDRPPLSAVAQDGSYPRPQLVRPAWADLSGAWGFALGFEGATTPDQVEFDLTITVPFPPESPASGIGRTEHHPVVWYRREITREDLDAAGASSRRPRLLLHFGAVDHHATVWLAGRHLGSHTGGQTPFWFDVTDVVATTAGPLELVVRAEDDPTDVEQPRGKQDWQPRPHSIWYERTTGIWQPVWLEAVADTHVTDLTLVPDITSGTVEVTLELSRPLAGGTVEVVLDHDGDELARHLLTSSERRVELQVVIERLRNGQAGHELLWTPDTPRLVGVSIVVRSDGTTDQIASYTGLRSVAVDERTFLLNDRPQRLRSVLEQGYWPESHLAAPSPDALREEVAAIKRLGFNAVRIHQKAEAPGFLYWADRLGLLVWVETANAYAFSDRAVSLLIDEWSQIVRRDRSHPCVVAWVPLNESWGVQHIAHAPAQRHYALVLANLTRTLDGSRPVISNDGWEHVDSDIWTIHDYTPAAEDIARRYGSPGALLAALDGFGPAGRRIRVEGAADRGQPFMLTEFGGISYDPAGSPEAWGYSTATTPESFRDHLAELLGAANAALEVSGGLAGYCYTQLADTGQETNGLLFADRTPKLPWEVLRGIVLGTCEGTEVDADADQTSARGEIEP